MPEEIVLDLGERGAIGVEFAAREEEIWFA